MYQMTVGSDLAQVLRELDLGAQSAPRRSGLIEVVSDSANVSAIVITLLQGPLTVAQWLQVLRRWRAKRSKDDVATLTISAPNVNATLQVNSEAEFEEAANAIVHIAASQKKFKSKNNDDLIV
jgi:hypothetical protein